MPLTNAPMTADGFDAAIVGMTRQQFDRPALVVYDIDKMIDILVKRDKMDRHDAVEYLEFNVLDAWVGAGTPLYIDRRKRTEKPQDFLAEHVEGD